MVLRQGKYEQFPAYPRREVNYAKKLHQYGDLQPCQAEENALKMLAARDRKEKHHTGLQKKAKKVLMKHKEIF